MGLSAVVSGGDIFIGRHLQLLILISWREILHPLSFYSSMKISSHCTNISSLFVIRSVYPLSLTISVIYKLLHFILVLIIILEAYSILIVEVTWSFIFTEFHHTSQVNVILKLEKSTKALLVSTFHRKSSLLWRFSNVCCIFSYIIFSWKPVPQTKMDLNSSNNEKYFEIYKIKAKIIENQFEESRAAYIIFLIIFMFFFITICCWIRRSRHGGRVLFKGLHYLFNYIL